MILRREDDLLWLDPEVADAQLVLPLLQPYASGLMSACEVEVTGDVRKLDEDPELRYRALLGATRPSEVLRLPGFG